MALTTVILIYGCSEYSVGKPQNSLFAQLGVKFISKCNWECKTEKNLEFKKKTKSEKNLSYKLVT